MLLMDNFMVDNARPLDGIKVLEMGQLIAGSENGK